MKVKVLHKKKKSKVGMIVLSLALIGGVCSILASQLKKKRKMIGQKSDNNAKLSCKPAGKTVAAGCQKEGQNEVAPQNTDVGCQSPEWERGIS